MLTKPIQNLLTAAEPLAEIFRELPGYYGAHPDQTCQVTVRQGDVIALRQALDSARLERFEKVFFHYSHDQESWSWTAVLRYHGALPNAEDADERAQQVEDLEREVCRFLEEREIVSIRSAGNGGPGRPFANAPWIQLFPDFIIASQNGGLDI